MTLCFLPPHLLRAFLLTGLFICLPGCLNQKEQTSHVIRPVKSYRVIADSSQRQWSYPGEVKAKIESTLAFRIGGKILERSVDIGDRIRKGQVLAKLDDSDYLLATQAIKAQLVAAKSEMTLAADELDRHRELFRQNVISPADLDKRTTAYIAAKERVNALQAQLSQSRNQIRYTALTSENAGVVTAVHAEPGQVVNSGQPTLGVAQEEGKEIHFDVPEDQIHRHRIGDDVQVSLWRDGENFAQAKIKDIAASADPANRTYKVKAILLEDHQRWLLGRSVTVRHTAAATDTLAIPLSAVFTPKDHANQPKAWLIDEKKHTVAIIPVQLGDPLPGNRIAVTGIKPGQLIVSAGVHRLREGQAVRLLNAPIDKPDADAAHHPDKEGI